MRYGIFLQKSAYKHTAKTSGIGYFIEWPITNRYVVYVEAYRQALEDDIKLHGEALGTF